MSTVLHEALQCIAQAALHKLHCTSCNLHASEHLQSTLQLPVTRLKNEGAIQVMSTRVNVSASGMACWTRLAVLKNASTTVTHEAGATASHCQRSHISYALNAVTADSKPSIPCMSCNTVCGLFKLHMTLMCMTCLQDHLLAPHLRG